jgi:hypothetical protein
MKALQRIVYTMAKEAVKPQLPSNCFRAKPEKVSEILARSMRNKITRALESTRKRVT